MKDPADEILQAEYDALTGNITYDSVTIPVYTQPINWEDLPADQFIHLDQVDWGEDSPKDRNLAEGTVQINIWTIFRGKNVGSKEPLNDISNQVLLIVDAELSLTSFTWARASVESVDPQEGILTSGEKVYGKELTISFSITEN